MNNSHRDPVIVIGAGFTGLAAAYELSRRNVPVIVLESDDCIGGLAGSFFIPGQRLEKFYHHWFTNDEHISSLMHELGVGDQILHRPTKTGSYYASKHYRLSSPLDVLKYKPLTPFARIRLGLLVLQARLVRNWQDLECISAADWIRQKAGSEVFEKVWHPLLVGKFGELANEVSAVWFWNKLVLRGGSRDRGGHEMLAYYKGGFSAFVDVLLERITAGAGEVHTSQRVDRISLDSQGGANGVYVDGRRLPASFVLVTTALPIFAELLRDTNHDMYVSQLRRIRYLGNTCLTLILDRSLSDTYWLNVSDPEFPYVGIIEHTNFESKSSYGGNHVVYMSKYLPVQDALYEMSPADTLEYALPHIQRMFPEFDVSWIVDFHVHKAEYSQPIVSKHYSDLIPEFITPIKNLRLATMAQIYPEDRGTNYAVREGRKAGQRIAQEWSQV